MKSRNLISVVSCGAMIAAGMWAASADAKFIKEAAEGGMAEVKLGELAQQRGTSQEVKDFGARMVADHTKAGDELKGIAVKAGVTVPSAIAAKEKSLYNKLSGLSGADFDRAYMSAMVKDHQEDIAEFEKEADNGKDPSVKDFASKTLPTLREHLQMAEKTATAVGAKVTD